MDKISNEILSLIFKYLPQQQRLQCMLVSRSWARVLSSGPMLETIIISDGLVSDNTGRRWGLLIKSIQTNKSIGEKCKRLVLDNQFQRELDNIDLATLLPNLTFLFMSSNSSSEKISTNHTPKNSTYSNQQSEQLQSWRDNLKTLIEYRYSGSTFALLKTGIFHRLTTLILGPNNGSLTHRLTETSKALKNTPVLTTLSIQQIYVSIFDLEELHQNVTKLTTLILIDCTWMLLGKKRTIIQPATTMRALKILDLSVSLDLPLDIAHYIVLKYTNLNTIYFTVDEYCSILRESMRNKLISLFVHIANGIGDQLSTFKSNAPADISGIFKSLNQQNSCLENLQINVIGDKTIINKMILLNSCHTLNTLSLFQVPRIRFSIFKNFTNLKSLEIEFIKKQDKIDFHVDLNKALAKLPKNLETLELSNVQLSVSQDSTWYDSSIKNFKLKNAETKENLPKYLSAHARKLNSLSLHDCQITTPFELPNHHLAFAEIIMPEKFTRWDGGWNMCAFEKVFSYVTHLKTTIGNKTHQYMHNKNIFSVAHPLFNQECCDIHDLSIHHTYKPFPFDERLPHIHFICAGVQTFYYNGYLLL